MKSLEKLLQSQLIKFTFEPSFLFLQGSLISRWRIWLKSWAWMIWNCSWDMLRHIKLLNGVCRKRKSLGSAEKEHSLHIFPVKISLRYSMVFWGWTVGKQEIDTSSVMIYIIFCLQTLGMIINVGGMFWVTPLSTSLYGNSLLQ